MVDPLIHMAARAGLAALFATAALHKLRDLGAFRDVVAGYRVLPAAVVPAAAVIVATTESVLAVALLRPGTYAAASAGAAALLGAYGVAIAINLARGRRDIDCGCLGVAGASRLGGWLLVRNAVLIGTCSIIWLPTTGRGLMWVDAVTLAGTMAALALLWTSIDRLAALTAGERRVARRSG